MHQSPITIHKLPITNHKSPITNHQSQIMKKKLKVYVLMVSTKFPAYHKKSGLNTDFPYKIINKEKIHTIRANYPLWKKRFVEINNGNACLSIRNWEDKPYKSKQKEIIRLYNYDGIGIQKLNQPQIFTFADIENKLIDWGDVARNDGLSFIDFCEWFKNVSNEPMAIIHFTKFRY